MIAQSFFFYFTDPILRAPTIGCMLMCLAASLIGVIVFLRKESLLGETLSHAAFPGIIASILVADFFSVQESQEAILSFFTLTGAFVGAFLGVLSIYFLEKRLKVAGDAALCFVLSSFFGIGLTLASVVQVSHTALYKQALSYLYGQAATMTDVHILIYGCLSLCVVIAVLLFYKELKIITFDSAYAVSMGIPVSIIDALFFVLTVLAVVVGIRSVGVVLMSAMLIAPAVAARQLTHRLSFFFLWAALFGLMSGFLGNYLSVEISDRLMYFFPSKKVFLPTGPMIVLSASFFCICSLLFSPERGLLTRFLRMLFFRYGCLCENILKTLWRINPEGEVELKQVKKYQRASSLYLSFLLWRLTCQGWIEKTKKGNYMLTKDGKYKAEKIVRFHRLWEVYLSHLGVGVERVHRNAEEIEHIMTPALEKELITLLKDPQVDPHDQPIPQLDGPHVR